MRAQRKGFTIIELLFVVTVIAIDIGLVAPEIQRARDGSARMKAQQVQEQTESTIQESPTTGAPQQPSTPAMKSFPSSPGEISRTGSPKNQSERETVSTTHHFAEH